MVENRYPDFSNILELVRELHNEKLLKEYLTYVRWGERPKCVHCDCEAKIYKLSTPGAFECGFCQKQFSVYQGTIFERTSIPLDIWFWNMFEFCIGFSTSPVGANRMGVQQKTAHAMNMRLRQAQWEELNRKLQGNVYADEMDIGADPVKDIRVYLDRQDLINNDLPPINTRPIFGMIEGGKAELARLSLGKKAKPGGQLLLFDIPNKSKDVLMDLAYKNTIPLKTNLYTDAWPSYDGLDYFFKNHYVINRSENGLYDYERYLQRVNNITRLPASEFDLISGNFITLCTNAIENIWSHVQIDYWRSHGYSQPYAQLYLNEFMFRFNHRHLEVSELFQILIKRCCNTPIYEVQEGKRRKVALIKKFTWDKKRGGGNKWKPIP